MAYWSTKRNNREQKNRPQVRSVFFDHLHDADFELLVALDAAGAEFNPSTTDRLRERDPLEFEYPPAMRDPFSQIIQMLLDAIILLTGRR